MKTHSAPAVERGERSSKVEQVGGIVCAMLMPHAPILVPDVGGERGGAAAASCRAMRKAAACVMDHQPETVVLISPHSPRKPGAFGLWSDDRLEGSFEQFGAPKSRVSLPNDQALANAIGRETRSRSVETWLIRNRSLDHGALVPLWFLAEAGWEGPTVILSLNYPDEGGLPDLGKAIAAAAAAQHRRIAIIASGDMSHRLTPDAPCGFHPTAHRFDTTFIQHVRDGDYRGMASINSELRELAAEDAVDSTLIAAAATGWNAAGHKLLSYEGPFGVGYGVAILFMEERRRNSVENNVMNSVTTPQSIAAKREGEILPGLARRSVETVLSGSSESPPAVSGDYLCTPRGVFVTVRRQNGELRGCVGTVMPRYNNLVEETWRNARVAALEDGRFRPVTAEELPNLRFHVSVLHSMENVSAAEELDPQRYGLIVSAADGRRGLLLPAIEGIDTAEHQLHLAREKGRIVPREPVSLQRFQVDSFEEPA